ncbi:hypothetical protein ABZ599_39945, partial [Streptomyces misionensis]|uniref:hypothetical protein n=1 Tax=Streptomyces misionensis TaxID=67331 RepID=UPI0033E192DB
MDDLFGPKKIYLTGLVVTGAAGIVPLLSHTFAAALVARVMVGIGTPRCIDPRGWGRGWRASVIFRGPPGRGSSVRPSSRSRTKRARHLPT